MDNNGLFPRFRKGMIMWENPSIGKSEEELVSQELHWYHLGVEKEGLVFLGGMGIAVWKERINWFPRKEVKSSPNGVGNKIVNMSS